MFRRMPTRSVFQPISSSGKSSVVRVSSAMKMNVTIKTNPTRSSPTVPIVPTKRTPTAIARNPTVIRSLPLVSSSSAAIVDYMRRKHVRISVKC